MTQSSKTTSSAFAFVRDNHAWMLVAAALLLLSTETLSLVPQGIMAALGIYRAWREPQSIYRDRTQRVLLFLFLCLWLPQLVSLVDAVNPERSAKIALLYPLYLFCGVFILRELAHPGNLSRLSLALLLIVLFWCVDALVQYATGTNLLGYPYQDGMLSGMFYPKLRLGIILAVLVPIALETAKNVNRDNVNRDSLYPWLLLIPFTVVVVLSGRRSAWLMLLIGLSAYLPLVFISLSSRARYIIAGALCVAVMLVGTVFYKSPDINRRIVLLTGILSSEYQAERATSMRTPLWDTAGNIFQDNWLNGVGPRGFRYAYRDYAEEDNYFVRPGQDGSTHPHLVFLEIAVETGVIGLIGFILFYLVILRYWWRGRHSTINGAWTAALLAATFPLNAHLAFYGSYWSGFLWLLTACVLAALAEDRDRKPRTGSCILSADDAD